MDAKTAKLLERLGSNLRKLRIDKGVSLETISLEVEIPVGLIYEIEKGKYNLWLWQLGRLSRYLGIPPSELLRRKL